MGFADSNSSQKLIQSGGHMIPPPPTTSAPPRPGGQGRDFASPGADSAGGSNSSSPTHHAHNSGAEMLHLRDARGDRTSERRRQLCRLLPLEFSSSQNCYYDERPS